MQSESDRFIPWKAQPHLSWKGQAFPGNKPRLMRNRPLIGGRVTQNKIQGGLGNSRCHSLGWQNNPLPRPRAPWDWNYPKLVEPLH